MMKVSELKQSLTARLLSRLLSAVVVCSVVSQSVQADEFPDPLEDMALLDLMNIEMVSGSKIKQELSDITAAAYVITAEDIKNAGVSDLPQLLDMVPGLFIAEASANSWSVGIRGFNSVFSNKMLVMIDGRSLFSPLFSGVFWEQLDLYLPDIERIEVIRGVGSTVWGANAVNGVINIITRSTLDNESIQMYTNTGSQVDYDAGIRFGAKIADQSYARVYFKSKQMDGNDYPSPVGGPIDDSWSSDAMGIKWEYFAGRDAFMLSGDYINQQVNDPVLITSRLPSNVVPIDNENANLSFQWQRQMSTDKAFTLSSQVQNSKRTSDYYAIDDQMLNLEFDTNYQWQDHQWLFGVGVRHHQIDFTPGLAFDVNTPRLTVANSSDEATTRTTILSGYIQDEWRFYPEHSVILGTKFERHRHNHEKLNQTYEASLWLPTLRYRFEVSDHSRLWAAVSHSGRIPSVAEQTMFIPFVSDAPGEGQNPFPWPLESFTAGNSRFDKETLLSFELGFRTNVNDDNNIDIALYHNRYSDVRGFLADQPRCLLSGLPAPACLAEDKVVFNGFFENGLSMTVNGLEVTWQSRFGESVNAVVNYTYTNSLLDALPVGMVVDDALLLTPKHQLAIQLDWQALDALNLRLKYKYVGNFDDAKGILFGPKDHFLDEQHNVDVIATYALSARWQAKFNVTNLFKQRGKEWIREFRGSNTSEVGRRFSFGVDVKF